LVAQEIDLLRGHLISLDKHKKTFALVKECKARKIKKDYLGMQWKKILLAKVCNKIIFY